MASIEDGPVFTGSEAFPGQAHYTRHPNSPSGHESTGYDFIEPQYGSVSSRSDAGWITAIAIIVVMALVCGVGMGLKGYNTGREIGNLEGRNAGRQEAVRVLQERMRVCTTKHRSDATPDGFNAECMPILVDTLYIAHPQK